MKTNILGSLLITAVASLSLASCSDFLDTTPTDSASDKLIWSKYEYAQLQANYMYEDLNLTNGYGDGTGCTRDCFIGLSESLTELFKYGGYKYTALNRIPSEFAYGTSSTLTNSYVDSYLGCWGSMYRYISTANQSISNLRKYGTFDEAKKTEIEAEFRFFRAFYYFTLAKRYSKMILYTENMDEYTKDKEPVDRATIYQQIYDDLKFAGENLPESTVPNGRLTSGVAYALMSRAMLYAERWQDARDAALKVKAQGYDFADDLETPFTPGGKGAIFQFCFDLTAQTHNFDCYYSPGGDKLAYSNPVSGGYGCPTQEMVESFEYVTGGLPDWSAWHTSQGTQETPPYEILEPRFAHTILYNGAAWKTREIESFDGGADGWLQWMKGDMCEGKSTTSYYLRKLVDENNYFANGSRCTKPFTFIRYAEVMLNLAEACYRLNDPTGALDALNAVRTRTAVGLPQVNASGENLFAAIRQERKVELAYEGHYYWDMRRWHLAHEAFTGNRAHGFKIVKEPNGALTYYYIEVDDQNRNFPEKMYTNPIPQSELENNKLITQDPAWN